MEKRIYRLITIDEWEEAQALAYVSPSKSDIASGFIHLSPKDEVLETARKYYATHEFLLALEITTEGLENTLKWEPVPSRNNVRFPHLYAEHIPISCVHNVLRIKSEPEGGFAWVQERTPLLSY